jgi:hypothetical protein
LHLDDKLYSQHVFYTDACTRNLAGNNNHLTDSQVSAEQQEKCRLLLLQASEGERVREQYNKLESQYNALALLVKDSPDAAQTAKVMFW